MLFAKTNTLDNWTTKCYRVVHYFFCVFFSHKEAHETSSEFSLETWMFRSKEAAHVRENMIAHEPALARRKKTADWEETVEENSEENYEENSSCCGDLCFFASAWQVVRKKLPKKDLRSKKVVEG